MISVIVPVYNAEDYLREAILSVFSQTYKDWELILVNDGSTDSSPQICDNASLECRKVRVTHIENRGVSHARNTGIDMALGEYIIFLDADDTLSLQALEILLNTALAHKVDIVSCNVSEVKEVHGYNLLLNNHNPKPILLSPIKAASYSLYQHLIDNSVCGKLYSRHLWNDLRFNENLRYEDLDICYRLFLKASSVAIIKETLYYYRQHDDSYIHTFNLGRSDVLKVTTHIIEFANTQCRALLPAAKDRQLSANFNILGLIAANGMEKDPEAGKIADSCWEKIRELRLESLRNPNVRLKNKIGIMASYLFGRKGLEIISRFVY